MRTIVTILTERGVLLNAVLVTKFRVSNGKSLLSGGVKSHGDFGIVADLLGGGTEVVATYDNQKSAENALMRLQIQLATDNNNSLISF